MHHGVFSRALRYSNFYLPFHWRGPFRRPYEAYLNSSLPPIVTEPYITVPMLDGMLGARAQRRSPNSGPSDFGPWF